MGYSFFSAILDLARILTNVHEGFVTTSGSTTGLIDTLLPIFTIQELGWTNTSYSEVYSITSVVGGIFGMFAGGALVDFFGDKKMIILYLIITIVLIIL